MWIIIGLLVIILIYILLLFNSLIKLNNNVEEAFSTMDVYLKKRWDLIPNIVETIKSYSKYEKTVFKDIVELRNKSYENMTYEDKIKLNEKLSKNINTFIILSEEYPKLKSNESYINLIKELSKIEEDIANARKNYNGTVRIYNNKVEIFPNNIFARIFGYKVKPMFKINNDEKESVKVNL